jgi:hypothetical protein
VHGVMHEHMRICLIQQHLQLQQQRQLQAVTSQRPDMMAARSAGAL